MLYRCYLIPRYGSLVLRFLLVVLSTGPELFEAVLRMPKDSEKNVPKMSLSGFERTTEVEEKVR